MQSERGTMKISEWKKRYKKRMIDRGELTAKQAEESYQAGKPVHDFDDEPEDAADMEMSYWD